MKKEAKLIWVLGSIWVSGYFIISYLLYSSWKSVGYSVVWWVIGIPLLFFTLVTIIMFVIAYFTSIDKNKNITLR